jgi:hypothetical protein
MAAEKGNNYSSVRKTNPTYTDEQIDQICDELLEWANDSDGLYLSSFIYEKYKRSDSWIYELSKHHKQLEEVLSMVKKLTAGKVVRHSWIGDRNSTFGEKILPMFCSEYKALLEWKEMIKKKELSEEEAQLIVNAVNYAKKQNG